MPEVSSSRLPVPHLFMVLSVGVFALLGLLAATIGTGRAGPNGSGRPIQGVVAGVLAGLTGAMGLLRIGAITLSSPAWVYAPLVCATLGTALGTSAPIQPG